jgi:hypothetical protein
VLKLDADTCYRIVVSAVSGASFVEEELDALRFATDPPDVLPGGTYPFADGVSERFCTPNAHASARVGYALRVGDGELAPRALGTGHFTFRLYTDGLHRSTAIDPELDFQGRSLKLVAQVEGRCDHPPPIDVAMEREHCYVVGAWLGRASAWTLDAFERHFRVSFDDGGGAGPTLVDADEITSGVAAMRCRGSDGPPVVHVHATIEMRDRARPLDDGGVDPNPSSLLGLGRCTTVVYAR